MRKKRERREIERERERERVRERQTTKAGEKAPRMQSDMPS
jgi:hypothetical protein